MGVSDSGDPGGGPLHGQLVDILGPLTDVFREGRLPMECTQQLVVLLPKGRGDFWGIIVLAFIWKMMSGIINQLIRTAVHFHDVL